jgi:hypothetical protein
LAPNGTGDAQGDKPVRIHPNRTAGSADLFLLTYPSLNDMVNNTGLTQQALPRTRRLISSSERNGR